MKWLRRLMPKTVTQQLMALLFVVLVLAQIGNMLILVDDRRLADQSKIHDQVIELLIRHIDDMPLFLPEELPRMFPASNRLPGAFFLSDSNVAASCAALKPMPGVEEKLEAALKAEQIRFGEIDARLDTDRKTPQQRGRHHPCAEIERQLPLRRPMDRPGAGRPRPEDGGRMRPPPGRPGLEGPPGQRRPPGQGSGPSGPDGQPQAGMQELYVSVELGPDLYINAMVPYYSFTGFTPRLLLSTLVLIVLTLGTAAVFARQIVLPLRRFTSAADRLGRGEQIEQISEKGPRDIKLAAAAFNTMQRRLTRTLESQRTMLRAVSHDLRTPLTALRIRAENIDDEPLRDKFIATIEDMSVMSEEILSWAKDISSSEEKAKVNLPAYLEAIVDDYQCLGQPVTLEGAVPDLNVTVRRIATKRALQNIIGNAVKYGGCARVSVSVRRGYMILLIEDDGPGIPKEEIDNVLKPFVRLEESRNKDTGGVGLGLSITDMIIHAQGGKLELANGARGLRVTVQLPI